MLIRIQNGEKNKALGARLPGGMEQILLARPIHSITGAWIGGPGCGRINDRLLTFQGVVQALWFKEITAGELTTPLLEEGSLPRGTHHAAHRMTHLQGPFGDLPTQRACAANHQNPHERSTKPAELRRAQGDDVRCWGRISILQHLEQQASSQEPNGNQHPKQGGSAEDFRSHGAERER